MTAEIEFNDIGSKPRMEFRIQAGRIDCSNGGEGVITLDIRGRGAEDVYIDRQGDSIVVREERAGWMRSGSVRISAVFPAGTEIEMAGASTSLYVDGSLGALIVKTASGDVMFGDAERLELKTASGDVRGGQVTGDVVISSASGDVHLDRVEGDLTANLASGDVDVRMVAGDVRAYSASGDVRIERCGGDEISVKSVSGDLMMGLPTGIRLDANITSLSGDIRLPESRSASPDAQRRRVRLDAKTVSGDIQLEVYGDAG